MQVKAKGGRLYKLQNVLLLCLFTGICGSGSGVALLSLSLHCIADSYYGARVPGLRGGVALITGTGDFSWRAVLPAVVAMATASAACYAWGCSLLERKFYKERRDRPEEWKCQPKNWLSDTLHREEVIWGCLNAFWSV
jgi:hypothetical protein